jgi:hypothetical protein
VITFILKVVVLTGLLSLLGWGVALLAPVPTSCSLARERSRLSRAFQDPSVVEEIIQDARRSRLSAERLVPPFAPAVARARFAEAAAVSVIHALVLWESLPVLGAILSAAFTLGLARREELRSGSSFASPTRAYLGKHLLVAAVVYLAAFALVPLSLPPASVWWGGGVAAMGGYLYVSNLPLKL